MGREKKYTAGTLAKAIDRYFASISRKKIITERQFTGELDKYGHPIFQNVPVKNALGDPVTVTEYLDPPNTGDLCGYLKIHHETWRAYCDPEKSPEMQACTSAAIRKIQDYREKQLMDPERKNTRGVEFLLAMEEKRKAEKKAEQEADGKVQIVIDV